MRIPFRQGLVTAPPNLLQANGSAVNLVIAQPAVLVATIADKQANYLISERSPITNAWTGPFVAGTTYWLYIEINRLTGQRTFGHTLLEPIEAAVAPSNPTNGQMWFDTTLNQMKEWNATAVRWIEKLRVLAARYSAGATFISVSYNSPSFTGTQIGSLQSTPIAAGALMYDENGDPIKRNNGYFFTTEDVVTASIASSTHVKLGSVVVEAVAESNIPAYRVVQFVDFNKVEMAINASMINTGAYGMVEVDAVTGTVVNVVLDGVITNTNWNWLNVNEAIYVGVDGELTTSVPANAIVVGYVVDRNTIVLRPSLATVNITAGGGGTNVGPATTSTLGIVRLSTTSATPSQPVVVETSDPRLTTQRDDVYVAPNQTAVPTVLNTVAPSGLISPLQVYRNGVLQKYGPAATNTTTTLTASITAGSNVLHFASTNGALVPGARITHISLPTNTVITSVDNSQLIAQLSAILPSSQGNITNGTFSVGGMLGGSYVVTGAHEVQFNEPLDGGDVITFVV